MGHWHVFKSHSAKLEDMTASINGFWNFLVGGLLAEDGLTKSWRDRVVNSLVEKLCDMAYELFDLRKMVGNSQKALAKAYSEADGGVYPEYIRSYCAILDFDCYYTVTDPDFLFIFADRVLLFVDKLSVYSNNLLQSSSKLKAYNETVFPEIATYYLVMQRKAGEICSKANRIAHIMRECMDMYVLADTSGASDEAADKYLKSLTVYNCGYGTDEKASIKDLYERGVFDTYDSDQDMSKAAKSVKTLMSVIGEYYDKASSVKNWKTDVSSAVANIDAITTLVDGERHGDKFTLSDGTNLYKAYASWAKRGIDKKAQGLKDLADRNASDSGKYVEYYDMSEKYSNIGKGLGFSGDVAAYIGALADMMEHKEGADVYDLIDKGGDMVKSGTEFAYQLSNGTKVTKKFAKEVSGYFTLAEAAVTFGVKLADDLGKYGEDGEITTTEGAKAVNHAAVHSLVSIFNSLTFDLFNVDADDVTNKVDDFSDEMSSYAADRLEEKPDANIGDKIGIAIESMWVGFVNSQNGTTKSIVYDNSMYYYIQEILLDEEAASNPKAYTEQFKNTKRAYSGVYDIINTDPDSTALEEKRKQFKQMMKE